MQGKVVSDKMNKTVMVEVESWVVHPIYKKRLKKTRKFSAHNDMEVKEGDIVEIVQTKPYSKTTNFKVKSIISTSEGIKK